MDGIVFIKASKIYMLDSGGNKIDSELEFWGNKKQAENLDKVPFYVEWGCGVYPASWHAKWRYSTVPP